MEDLNKRRKSRLDSKIGELALLNMSQDQSCADTGIFIYSVSAKSGIRGMTNVSPLHSLSIEKALASDSLVENRVDQSDVLGILLAYEVKGLEAKDPLHDADVRHLLHDYLIAGALMTARMPNKRNLLISKGLKDCHIVLVDWVTDGMIPITVPVIVFQEQGLSIEQCLSISKKAIQLAQDNNPSHASIEYRLSDLGAIQKGLMGAKSRSNFTD